ncbi:putative inactive protein kinase [Vespula squamosa]|uniref:Inactive protein kinase n=1 Tax=Vespula squamosa TaxID=30214 RepID=A0ABD2AF86_VESSQ
MVLSGIDAKIKAWTPQTSYKFQDNIISSDHTTTKPFVPSYEKERRPCIELLLSNEYQRIWWREKQIWEKAVIPKTSTRKLLPRMIIKKKTKK